MMISYDKVNILDILHFLSYSSFEHKFTLSVNCSLPRFMLDVNSQLFALSNGSEIQFVMHLCKILFYEYTVNVIPY